MSERIRTHLRTNVVGYIAIFLFAIGGTAYATHPGGANTISSDDIINGEVKSSDLGAAATTENKLAPDAVTRPKIADDAVTAAEVDNSAIRAPELATNAVTSQKVRNEDLTADDLGAGSVTVSEIADETFFDGDIVDFGFGDLEVPDDAIQSNEISDGAVGGAELSVVTALGPNTTITNDGELTFLQVSCETGEKALGGGATNFGAEGVYMTQSSPLPADGGEVPTGWQVSVENQSGAEQTGNAYAICTEEGIIAESAKRN